MSTTVGHWKAGLAALLILLMVVATAAANVAPLMGPETRNNVTLTPRGHFGGYLASLTMPPGGGDLLYVGTGAGLAALDVSTPSAPRQAGSLSFGAGDVVGVSISGATACVVWGNSIATVDLSTPIAPTIVHSMTLDSGAWSRSVAYVGSYAYVGAAVVNDGVLQVYNVSDPSNPIFVTSVGTPGQASKVVVAGQRAYVADGWNRDLLIYDVSNPASPTLLGTYNSPGDAHDVWVEGNIAYLAAGSSGGLQIVDVSNPASPTQLGWYNSAGDARRLAVDGDTVYLAEGDRTGVSILDVSTPASPSLLGTTDATWGGNHVAISGDTLYVGTELMGVRLVDVSTAASPSTLGEFSWPNVVSSVAVDESLVASASPSVNGPALVYMLGDSKLWVIDNSDPAAPVVLGTAETGRALYHFGVVRVSGARAYVAWWPGWGGEGSGLVVFDVSDSSNPTRLGQYALPAGVEATDLWVVGTTAYVTTVSGSNGYLRTYDVSDPTSIAALDVIDTPGDARRVTVSGGVAYVVDGTSGLRLYDASNPSALSALGHVDPPSGFEANCVTVEGVQAYLGIN